MDQLERVMSVASGDELAMKHTAGAAEWTAQRTQAGISTGCHNFQPHASHMSYLPALCCGTEVKAGTSQSALKKCSKSHA